MNENKTIISQQEWKEKLSEEEFRVLREKGTEASFSGKYNKFYKTGTYQCAACGNRLFSSEAKYDSGSGWPSFWAPLEGNAVEEIKDSTFGMQRVEVVCNACKGHLGHVFNDGPKPTGLRYCINSVSLKFEE